MVKEPSKQQRRGLETEEIPVRIRTRRQELGWKAYELARKVGVSPSWISLIETGMKVPSEKVAARIAEALGEDVEQFRIWAGKARLGEQTLSWVNSLERWHGLWSRAPFLRSARPNPSTERDSSQTRSSGTRSETPIGAQGEKRMSPEEELKAQPKRESKAPADEMDLRMTGRTDEELMGLSEEGIPSDGWIAERREGLVGSPLSLEASRLRIIPLLSSAESIPERGEIPSRAVIGHIPLDRRILPESSGHLIALEVTQQNEPFVVPRLSPGDLVILDLEDREVAHDIPTEQIYLVRSKQGILFSRCAVKGRYLILQPDRPDVAADVLEIPPGATSLPLIVGRVIWSSRRYARPQE